jgi:quercetin dioxygenase-like cupin family protein
MKTSTHLTMGVLLASLALVVAPKTAMAQDMARAAPSSTKVLLENDRVRVLEVRQKPGEKGAMHSHPASLVCPLTTSKAKFTAPDGKTTEGELKAGEVTWREAETHAVENVGTTESHVLVIELKK